jgi:hypothetical protein
MKRWKAPTAHKFFQRFELSVLFLFPNCISSGLHVDQGDTTKARTAYQDFHNFWKSADPDIPIFLAAKSEFAKLK